MVWFKRLRGGLWLGLGYLLSPLSWWNDLVFNLPIAYGFAYLVTLGHRAWFVPATILGYWLSNVVGMVMMQWGATDVLRADRQTNWQRDLLIGLASSTVYTAIAAGLVYFNVLRLPPGLTLG
ncbi:hypothetical protein IQ254_23025 [Nodosilinea sp. LEGE 07088]|uniref:hypothetical protein n=1 Tax=Nodosilinea sp. LEGE 07088 TaxID=2777968 RepID=UPI0018817225|nr:hypothetical protein [Nodosilinea sp. LEGE 07088]MBE9140034.1 hypothetical protein [Nodosilinea sp. LEGE 07088]